MNFDRDYLMTIDGKAVSSPSTIDVYNPATGTVFASVPDCTAEQLDAAVESSKKAFKTWKKVPIEDRAEYLRKIGRVITENADELTTLFTQEQGRPLDFARLEIESCEEWLKSIAEVRPPVNVSEDSAEQFVETRYFSLGVVCGIAPWNFPINLAIWKIAPALLAGNTMVLKPSPFTPLCTLKIAELLRDVLPEGVLNVITGGDNLGPMMTSHPGFAKISFTGSTATGKRVMESASKDLKRLTLELGGNDAAIVLPDVDVNEIAEKIFFGAFFNASQICIATKRLYVHEDVYEPLKDKLLEIARATKVGNGLEAGIGMGPIQNKRQYDRVMNLLDDAKQSGLSLEYGSEVPEGDGYFVPITIVDNPPEDSRVVQEEAFGPILPMIKFNDIDKVIEKANDSEYGLAGAVWSKDDEKGIEVARQIETGTVWINQNLILRPDTVFAGHKNSGFGGENGIEGLLEFMQPQAVYLAKSA